MPLTGLEYRSERWESNLMTSSQGCGLRRPVAFIRLSLVGGQRRDGSAG